MDELIYPNCQENNRKRIHNRRLIYCKTASTKITRSQESEAEAGGSL